MKMNVRGGMVLSVLCLSACEPDAAGVQRCDGDCPEGKSCDNNTADVCSFDWTASDPCASSRGNAFCITYDDEEYAVHCGGTNPSATNCSATGTECEVRKSGSTWYSGCDGVEMPALACTGDCPGGSECGESWNEVSECSFSWSPGSPCPGGADGIFCITDMDGQHAVDCNKSPAGVTLCDAGESCFVDTVSDTHTVQCMESGG